MIRRNLSLILCISFGITSCSSFKETTENVTISNNYGDGVYTISIGTNQNKVDSFYRTDTLFKKYLDIYGGPKTYIVRPEVLSYISEFMSSHCNSIDRSQRKSLSIYTVKLYKLKESQTCTYWWGKDGARDYFKDLSLWITNSPYRDECKDLVLQLNLFSKNG